MKLYLSSVCVSVLSLSASASNVSISVSDPATAAFSLSVGSVKWLDSSDTKFFVDGTWHRASDGTLKLGKTEQSKGTDELGAFDETQFSWTAGKTPIQTKIKVYNSDSPDGFVVFSQLFPSGATNTSMGHNGDVNSGFPSFDIGSADAAASGYLAFSGCMIGDAHVGQWDESSEVPGGGLDSGPVAVYDIDGKTTVVLSSYSQFMANSHAVHAKTSAKLGATPGNTLDFGTIGTMDPIPAGYSTSFIAYVGASGINEAFAGWGETLLRTYGKSRDAFENDFMLNYLSYSTDNGAYYYYHTEGTVGRWKTEANMEPSLLGVKAYADKQEIPYRAILLDSWWYPKDAQGDGVLTWTALPSVFPHGLNYLWDQTGWPVIGHNRFWSTKTPYAKQNGGDYDFEIADGDKMAMPLEQRFWDDLLRNSTEWGLKMYEQDWLNEEFEGVTRATTDVNLARNWLLQMGQGAADNGITIQYCMPLPRHVLQSVEIQAVTNFRASGDYSQGRSDQWKVGQSGIVASALSLGASKDNYWSTADQPDSDWKGSTEPRSSLQSAVSSYSLGPVAPSDRIGLSDAELINRACNTMGQLLRPSTTATAIDKTFLFRSKLLQDGPDGEVWSSRTEFRGAGLQFHHVLAADLKSDFNLVPSDLTSFEHHHHSGATNGTTIAYTHPTKTFKTADIVVQTFDADHPLKVAKCGQSDFGLYHTAPVHTVGDSQWALLGEVSKWVPVSTDRILYISVEEGSLVVDVKGAEGENVTLGFYDATNNGVVAVNCALNNLGRASFSVPAATCN